MTTSLLAWIGGLLAVAVVVKGFSVFWSKPRPGPENNWTNQAYAARKNGQPWSESDTGTSTAPPEGTMY